MYLKSIAIQGFKSFAGHSKLDFTSQITGIVGPNGSGKSNAAEAFRFVLGEQSMKSMRGKKSEDLLFNGNQQTPRANRAQVNITFDNTSGLLDLDFPEVTIGRTVHRDGSNEYFINSSKVRLKDIAELLAGAHIAGHNIISQGEADRILSVNSRERKSMIEEALGLRMYQMRKNESQRKIEKTIVNISEAQSLRRELAPHIRFLEKQVDKIKQADAVRQELVSQYGTYLQEESRYITSESERLAKFEIEPQKELRDVSARITELEDTLSKQDVDPKARQEQQNLQSSLHNLETQKSDLIRVVARTEASLQFEQRLLEEARQKSQKIITTKSTQVMLRDVEDCFGRIYQVVDTASSLEEAREGVSRETLAFSANETNIVEPDVVDVGPMETRISDLQTELGTLSSKLNKVDQDIADIRNKIEELIESIASHKDGLRDSEKALYEAQSKKQSLEHTIIDSKRQQQILAEIRDHLRIETAEAQALLGLNVSELPTIDASKALVSRADQKVSYRTIERLKIKLEEMGAAGGADTLKEFEETKERDEFLAREIEDLTKTLKSLEEIIVELDVTLDKEFKTGIATINTAFGKFFAAMFGGGEAGLAVTKEKLRTMEDEDEQLYAEGVAIKVSLPRKRVKSLDMLSGGERALTSIALIFALSQVNPPPFLILDETDAALDEANSKKYGDMIQSLAEKSQLILITHNRETMSRAGMLYGVTMNKSGASTLLSVSLEEAEKVAK